MLFFTNINDTLLLVALGIGYIVLYFAKREEKGLQLIGYIIGWVVIILASLYILSNFWVEGRMRCLKSGGYQGKMFKHMMPPKATPPAPGQ